MTEIEVKFSIPDISAIRGLLRRLGWRVRRRRHHEKNEVYDRRGRSPWLTAGRLLRVREAGKQCVLTVKLPVARQGNHKIREEYEVEVNNAGQLRHMLAALDFQPAWRYEKFRTEFSKAGDRGKILLDETPVGDFLELEGSARWIDRTAAGLGFSKADYIVETYWGLFVECRKAKGSTARDMLFGEPGLRENPAARKRRSRV